MTVQVPIPASLVKYVKPDGRLTDEGLKLLERIVAKLDDHENRITALEP